MKFKDFCKVVNHTEFVTMTLSRKTLNKGDTLSYFIAKYPAMYDKLQDYKISEISTLPIYYNDQTWDSILVCLEAPIN